MPTDESPPTPGREDPDAQLIGQVRRAGASSTEDRYLRAILAEVGMGFLLKCSHKTLVKKLSEKGIRIPSRLADGYSSNIEAVYHLAVSSATERFLRIQVHGNSWDPAKGATIRSYFIGAVLFAFAEEYRHFYNENRPLEEAPHEDLTEEIDRSSPFSQNDPESLALDRELIEQIFSNDKSGRVRRMFRMAADGYSQKEIALQLGMTHEAVSSAMRRTHRRALTIRKD